MLPVSVGVWHTWPHTMESQSAGNSDLELHSVSTEGASQTDRPGILAVPRGQLGPGEGKG